MIIIKRLTIITALLIFTIIFSSCKNKYYYIIGKEPEKTLRAENDSVAYMEAFQKYIILRKVYSELAASGGESTARLIPDYFSLFNKDHVNITMNVTFSNKEKLEKFITEMINKTPNKYKKSKDKTTTFSK